jgi:alpha-ribazole phosphatase/probable phosphoglycerate mutase
MNVEQPGQASNLTRLVLVRHGEPDDSVRGRCYGRLDPGLSPRGEEQMRTVKRLLRGLPISRVYSSPRRRALESARLLAPARIDTVVDDRLREIDFGELEGLMYDEIATRFPGTYAEWMRHPTVVVFPGGEPFPAMSGRVRDALDELRRAHSGELVVVVSHGGVNRIVLAHALGLEPAWIFRLDQGHGCVNIIDFFGDDALVRAINLQPWSKYSC